MPTNRLCSTLVRVRNHPPAAVRSAAATTTPPISSHESGGARYFQRPIQTTAGSDPSKAGRQTFRRFSSQEMCIFRLKYIGRITPDISTIGRKFDQPLDKAYPVDFAFRVVADTPDYLTVRLDADTGPLSTRNYRIVFEAIPLESGRTFIHLTYSYAYGLAGRLALQTYLGTLGSSKVGFTVVGTQSDGQPRHVGGLRGVVERNSMRYYLAIEAFLGALSAPPPAQLEKRLHDWFDAVERYPLQLHEMERSDYLEMKRREYSRQQADLGATTRLALRN